MRIPEPKEWHFEGRRSVQSILEELAINPETVIVICGDSLLTPDTIVEGDVEIEIRPAISGGAGGAGGAGGPMTAGARHPGVPGR